MGAVEQGLEGARFHHLALAEHHHPVGYLCHGIPVMANEEHGHSAFALQHSKQCQNLKRHLVVKGCGGFVANKKLRIHGNSHGNHYALALSARELVRVLAHNLFGVRQLHSLKLCQGSVTRRRPAQAQGRLRCFGNLPAHAHRWIQGRHWFLKNHGFGA